MDNIDSSIKIDMMIMSPKQHRNVPIDVLAISDKTILETDLKSSAAKQQVEIKECSICLLDFI
jgi:hypothetical protein